MSFLTLDAPNSEADGTSLFMPPGSPDGVGIALVVGNEAGGEGLKGWASGGIGVHGESEVDAGVYGESTGSVGVHGKSAGGAGVYGESLADASDRQAQTAGVYGSSANQPRPGGDGTNAGVWGDSSIDFGVVGTSAEFVGIFGSSPTRTGVIGSTDDGAHAGVIGTGTDNGFGVGGFGRVAGVFGEAMGVGASPSGAGVWGQSAVPSQSGVEGFSSVANGVRGVSTGSGPAANGVVGFSAAGSGVIGVASSPSSSAAGGIFFGGLICASGHKSAAVPHPDGSHRLLYSMESPESWFEDFGRSNLENGKANVELDTDFAAVVDTEDYHVFLSPEGESSSLYIARRTPAGFEVRESQGGTSNIAFSYRVVARRGDLPTGRMERFELPEFLRDEMVKVPKAITDQTLRELDDTPSPVPRSPLS